MAKPSDGERRFVYRRMPLEANAPLFRWEAPDGRVRIDFSIDVMGRLEREMMEAFRAVAERGAEIGGILLGEPARNGTPARITGYRLLPCAYSRGPLYRLTEPERAAFCEAARAENAIGLFRSHTRRELGLNDEDVAMAAECCPAAGSVFLLVKPFAAKPPVAGFCMWEGTEFQRVPRGQFPFHAPGQAHAPAPALAPPAPAVRVRPAAYRAPVPETIPLANYPVAKGGRHPVLGWLTLAAATIVAAGLVAIRLDLRALLAPPPPPPAPVIRTSLEPPPAPAAEAPKPPEAEPVPAVKPAAPPKPKPRVRQGMLPPPRKPHALNVPDPPRLESKPDLTVPPPDSRLPAAPPEDP